VGIEELMDVASEPHEFNIYMATNFSALTENIVNRFSNVLCNSNEIKFISIQSTCAIVAASDFVNKTIADKFLTCYFFKPDDFDMYAYFMFMLCS